MADRLTEGWWDMGPHGRSSDHCHRHKLPQARDSSTDLGTRFLVVCLEGGLAEGALGIQILMDGKILDHVDLHRRTISHNSSNNEHVVHSIDPHSPCNILPMRGLAAHQYTGGTRHHHTSPWVVRTQLGMERGRRHKSIRGWPYSSSTDESMDYS